MDRAASPYDLMSVSELKQGGMVFSLNAETTVAQKSQEKLWRDSDVHCLCFGIYLIGKQYSGKVLLDVDFRCN